MLRALLFGLLVFEVAAGQIEIEWTRVLPDSVPSHLIGIEVLPSGELVIGASSYGSRNPCVIEMTQEGVVNNIATINFLRGLCRVLVLSNGNLIAARVHRSSGVEPVYILDSNRNPVDSILTPEGTGVYHLIRGQAGLLVSFYGMYMTWWEGNPIYNHVFGATLFDSLGQPERTVMDEITSPGLVRLATGVAVTASSPALFVGPMGHTNNWFFVWSAGQWNREFCLSLDCDTYFDGNICVVPASSSEILVISGMAWGSGPNRSRLTRLISVDADGDTIQSRDLIEGSVPVDLHLLADSTTLLLSTHYTEDRANAELSRIDRSGQLLWSTPLEISESFIPMESWVAPGGECLVVGQIINESGQDRAIVVKTASVLAGYPRENLPASRFSLLPAYPNPFNPTTEIRFELSRAGHTTLRVFDLLGREVAVLIDEQLSAGSYTKTFDGSSVPSGVYLYRLETGVYSETKKMVLLK